MNIGDVNSTNSFMRNGLVGVNRRSAKGKNTVPTSTTTSNAGTFNLKIGGLTSRALPDGSNVTVYKADSYTKDSPLLRVVTTSADGKESEQIIDPNKVDVTNATEQEMLALNSYLVDEGKLSNDVYRTGMYTDSSVSDAKKNFAAIIKELMDMQYSANNLSGYTKYNRILSAYDDFLEK